MTSRARRVPIRGLAIISTVGFALRIAAVQRYYRHLLLGFTDNFFYSKTADLLAAGHGYSDPFVWQGTGRLVASADHPPLYATYLAVFSWLGLDAPMHHRVASCLLGAITILVVGVAATKVAGPRAGLLSAGFAAVYPALWIADGTLVAESPFALAIALVILTSLRLVEVPSYGRAAVVGLCIGAAALTRSEGSGLLILLLVPLLLVCAISWPRRVALFALATLTTIACIAPWAVRNAQHFEEPVPLAYGAGYVLKYGNCDETYEGKYLGYWVPSCSYTGPMIDKSVGEVQARHEAMEYISEHKARFLVVALARVGRMWHAYRVEQGMAFDDFFERRGVLPVHLGVAGLYVGVLLSGVALWTHRRNRALLVISLALFASATVSAALAFGITRYRIAADVGIAVLVGIGLDAIVDRVQGRHDVPETPAP